MIKKLAKKVGLLVALGMFLTNTLNPLMVIAMPQEQLDVFKSGIHYFDVEDCVVSSEGAAAAGDLDKFLQALAKQESGGNPIAANPTSDARGKYQILDRYYSGYAKGNYPPAAQYSSAKDAPESMQDAIAYISIYKRYMQYDQDLLRTAASWIWPAAADSPNDPEMDKIIPGNGTLTPRKYADNLIKNMRNGSASSIKLHYRDAQDFDKYYKRVDGNKNTPLGSFPSGNNASASGQPTTQPRASSGSGQTVIIVDPGHAPSVAGQKLNTVGLLDINSPNNPEMKDVYDIAKIVERELTAANYKVVLTKTSLNDTPNQYKRAKIADQNQGDLALSIHYWRSEQGGDKQERPFGQWGEIYPQKVGGYRIKGENGDGARITFSNQAVAQKSQLYSQKFKQARNKNESNVIIKDNSFDNRSGVAPGNLSIVQLLSSVPWVFNESGAPPSGLSQSQKQKYADGLIEGVKKSIGPNEHNGASTQTDECVDVESVGDASAIVDWALKFAWDDRGHSTTDAKPLYKEWHAKVYPSWGTGDYSACNQYVAVVMRASGADKKYNIYGTNDQEANYVKKHPEKYTKIANPKSTKDLVPGDIFFNNQGGSTGHTFIYVGNQTGGNIRDGSYHKHAPQAGELSWYTNSSYLTAYRLK